ncbi:hypothetical protein [Methylobacterium bullatum]|uniref:hypothetical protein n=1 Tax=Methylobacterium bullatum TaxID=570505 RepID=UPI001AED4ADC|nr:hypothetical protein [Methylobacterium bullatum]
MNHSHPRLSGSHQDTVLTYIKVVGDEAAERHLSLATTPTRERLIDTFQGKNPFSGCGARRLKSVDRSLNPRNYCGVGDLRRGIDLADADADWCHLHGIAHIYGIAEGMRSKAASAAGYQASDFLH